MAAYQPGLGAVTLGPADAVQAEFRQSLLLRYDTKLASLAAAGMLGCIFLLVWLMRRSDIVYGWFALFTFAASIYNLNFVVDSPWPFGSTHGWQALNASAHLLASISYALFLFRYEERHFPGVERWLGALCIGGMVLALAAAPWAGLYRNGYYMCSAVTYYGAVLWLARRAVHNWRADLGVLLACQIAPLIVSIHDFALLFGWLRGDNYLFSLTSMVTLFGSGFVLAYRFVAARRQVEGFNSELRREVDLATTTLGETLAREHRLALASTRADERLQIARDLHDGFGGTLIGAIARLEQTQQELPRAEVAGLLKGMRDDLRLLIDSTTHEQLDLVELIAPLRHRSALLLEAAGIASRWHLENIEGVELDSKASLDLLRLLQEALTNVFKHSRAQRVDVWLSQSGGQVLLRVRDDGLGLDASGADKSAGTGLQSIKHRAERLGGRFQIASGAGHTELEVAFAIQ
jgi:signal transduction histidine kinase